MEGATLMEHNWDEYFDTSSEYWGKVQRLYNENEHFPKKVVKGRNLHHKFPKSFSKKDKVEIDNDADNLISLSLSDHFLVHYYLWKCSRKGYRQSMALAFQFMRKKAIKYASDETIEELARDYANIMEDVSKKHSEIGKMVTSSKKWRDARDKVDWSAAAMKAHKTLIKNHTVDELKEINKSRGNFCRGKTYDEIYGEDKANTLRMLRAEQCHSRKLSDETKDKISRHNKGKCLSEEVKKKMSEQRKARKWYNNGEVNIHIEGEPPDGFVPGRKLSEEHRHNVIESNKRRKKN